MTHPPRAAASPDALVPVGRDCDCGMPLVWRQGHQWCAVYGSHSHLIQSGQRGVPVRYLRPIDDTLAILAARNGATDG